jgi:Integrase core domain
MLRWGAERAVNLHFIDPGKQTQNAQIESLNGKIVTSCLTLIAFGRSSKLGARPPIGSKTTTRFDRIQRWAT